ncbi:NAD-dependent epimerase/dehydratase family protein [Paenibacillus sp. oral taxon 786]|uniref:NAD-dependent epimerase/dehydratase family protein n=1 Tax=Paenibacillus sp. oral taxon 786 TaxID=652715 RepID=UPI0026C40BEE
MAKVVVTGGSGMLGRYVVREFVEHGYDVLNVDIRPFRRPGLSDIERRSGAAWRMLQCAGRSGRACSSRCHSRCA